MRGGKRRRGRKEYELELRKPQMSIRASVGLTFCSSISLISSTSSFVTSRTNVSASTPPSGTSIGLSVTHAMMGFGVPWMTSFSLRRGNSWSTFSTTHLSPDLPRPEGDFSHLPYPQFLLSHLFHSGTRLLSLSFSARLSLWASRCSLWPWVQMLDGVDPVQALQRCRL